MELTNKDEEILEALISSGLSEQEALKEMIDFEPDPDLTDEK